MAPSARMNIRSARVINQGLYPIGQRTRTSLITASNSISTTAIRSLTCNTTTKTLPSHSRLLTPLTILNTTNTITSQTRQLSSSPSSSSSSQNSLTPLTPNQTFNANFPVLPSDLASTISPSKEDIFPSVLATSRLVAFMEIVCARLLSSSTLDSSPLVPSTSLSVGVRIDLTHTAATPEAGNVDIEATYVGKEGKVFVFDVLAKDEAGEIGRARHTRAIVDLKRLEGGALKRIGK